MQSYFWKPYNGLQISIFINEIMYIKYNVTSLIFPTKKIDIRNEKLFLLIFGVWLNCHGHCTHFMFFFESSHYFSTQHYNINWASLMDWQSDRKINFVTE